MKIVICGSSAICKDMVRYRDELNSMGHQAIIHPEYGNYAAKGIPEDVKTEHHVVKRKYGYIKWYYNAIANSDAILVLNIDKNGVKNYIGGNTLMEMGFAHVHDKKVFLLNAPPEIGYKEEILAVTDNVLNGDLRNIS